jgi:hypothetical protein
MGMNEVIYYCPNGAPLLHLHKMVGEATKLTTPYSQISFFQVSFDQTIHGNKLVTSVERGHNVIIRSIYWVGI